MFSPLSTGFKDKINKMSARRFFLTPGGYVKDWNRYVDVYFKYNLIYYGLLRYTKPNSSCENFLLNDIILRGLTSNCIQVSFKMGHKLGDIDKEFSFKELSSVSTPSCFRIGVYLIQDKLQEIINPTNSLVQN